MDEATAHQKKHPPFSTPPQSLPPADMAELKTLASKAAARAADYAGAADVDADGGEASEVVEDDGADSDAPLSKADARAAKRAKKEAKRAAREARKRKRAAEEEARAEKKAKKKAAVDAQPLAATKEAAADDDAPPAKTKKDKKKKEGKRSKKEDGDAAPTTPPQKPTDAAADNDAADNDAAAANDDATKDAAPSGRGGTAARAFKRVDESQWLGKKGSWNNSYEATFGDAGWGAKAQAVLGQVRGKDFRHEKTKKKRGSYRGGAIDSGAVCSYKFDDSD